MFNKTIYCGLVLMSMAMAAPASAVAVIGSIDMSGGFTTDSGDLANAASLYISPAWTVANTGTGAFAPVGNRERAVGFNAFTFDPGLTGPVDPLWWFVNGSTAYSFTLTSVEVLAQSSTELVLFGTGILYVTGYDPTEGNWEFTGRDRNGRLKFISETGTNRVPEPDTLALLGLGLAGLGFGRRRKTN